MSMTKIVLALLLSESLLKNVEINQNWCHVMSQAWSGFTHLIYLDVSESLDLTWTCLESYLT